MMTLVAGVTELVGVGTSGVLVGRGVAVGATALQLLAVPADGGTCA